MINKIIDRRVKRNRRARTVRAIFKDQAKQKIINGFQWGKDKASTLFSPATKTRPKNR